MKRKLASVSASVPLELRQAMERYVAKKAKAEDGLYTKNQFFEDIIFERLKKVGAIGDDYELHGSHPKYKFGGDISIKNR